MEGVRGGHPSHQQAEPGDLGGQASGPRDSAAAPLQGVCAQLWHEVCILCRWLVRLRTILQLIYSAIGVGITAAAGTRLALQ